MQNAARILAGLGLAWALVSASPALSQTTTIAVTASGELPGFRTEEAAPWLAARMSEGGFDHWRFTAADPAQRSPNRIEWSFDVLPYAGGEVRRLFPMAERGMDVHIQGRHRMISAQARLFLDGEYQTTTFAQEAVRGGAGDMDLADFVIKTTRMLDNAWHAVDLSPPEHSPLSH